MEESFGNIIEFGVALAGFSAVAFALSHEPGEVEPLDRFRGVALLQSSLSAAFGATVVLLGSAYGLSGESLWRFVSVFMVFVLAASFLFPVVIARQMSEADRNQLSPFMWMFSRWGNVLLGVYLLANAIGWPVPPSPGPVMLALVYLLFLGALLFVRMLVVRPGRAGAEKNR